MKFMALDVSTKSTGLAIFDNSKLIDYKLITASSTDLIKRIQKITNEIQTTIEEHKDIEKLVLEEVRPEDSAVGMNTNTHRALMWAQAAIAFMLHENYPKITMEYIYPGTWRKECGIKTGRGVKRESLKKADIKFVEDNFNLSVNDDVADAICIGYAFAQTNLSGFNWA